MLSTFGDIERRFAGAQHRDCLASVDAMLRTFCKSIGYDAEATDEAAADDDDEKPTATAEVKQLRACAVVSVFAFVLIRAAHRMYRMSLAGLQSEATQIICRC